MDPMQVEDQDYSNMLLKFSVKSIGKNYVFKKLYPFVLNHDAVSRQWARKFEKVQAKKLVKSNKSKHFFREIEFWKF